VIGPNPRRRKTHLVQQMNQTECGLCCCAMLLRSWGSRRTIADLRARYEIGRDGVNVRDIVDILRENGARPHVFETGTSGLVALNLPAICHWDGHHYVLVDRISARGATVYDPGNGRSIIGMAELEKRFSGIAVTIDTCDPGKPSRLASPTATLLSMAHGRLGLLLATLAAALVSTLATLALPQLLTRVFPDTSGAPQIVGPVAILAGIALGYALLLAARAVVALVTSVAVGKDMYERVFSHLMRLRYAYFTNRGSGELLFDLDAVQRLRALIATDLISVVVGVVVIATLLGWLATLSLAALGVAAVVIGLLIALTTLSGHALRHASVEETRQRAELQSVQIAALSAIETVKTNAMEDSYISRWRGANDAVQREFSNLQALQAVFTSLTAGLQLVGPIVIVMVVSLESDTRSTATVVAVQALGGFLLGQVSAVAGSLTQVTQGWTLLERVTAVIAQPVDDRFVGAAHIGPDPVGLRVSSVSFSYATFSDKVLDEVNLNIPAGSMTAIVGPSGSGKSTLGRLLAGLYAPTLGTISLGDLPLEEYDRKAFFRDVAYVPQTIVLDRGTLRDSIAWGVDPVSDEEVLRAAARVGLAEEITALPLGLDTPVAQLGQNFSGGQRQRIALARAALKRARVVVLDEATSSLDYRAESLVTQYFRDLAATRVVIAHRLSTIVDADCIYVLDRGRIVQAGTHHELVDQPGLYRDLYARSSGLGPLAAFNGHQAVERPVELPMTKPNG